jgi:L-threonylcarbamoyladenylate synthase
MMSGIPFAGTDIPMMSIPFSTADEMQAALPRVITHLHANRSIAYPTETIYGLGGRTTAEALSHLRTLKARDAHKRFLILVDGLPMIARSGLVLTPAARVLSEAFWPGPLTIILPPGDSAPGPVIALRGESGGVAVRCSSHSGVRAIVSALVEPITSTSANVPDLPPATSGREIVSMWADAVRTGELLVLDGGPLIDRLPSTIVDCTREPTLLVRRGAVPVERLRSILPELAGG